MRCISDSTAARGTAWWTAVFWRRGNEVKELGCQRCVCVRRLRSTGAPPWDALFLPSSRDWRAMPRAHGSLTARSLPVSKYRRRGTSQHTACAAQLTPGPTTGYRTSRYLLLIIVFRRWWLDWRWGAIDLAIDFDRPRGGRWVYVGT